MSLIYPFIMASLAYQPAFLLPPQPFLTPCSLQMGL